MEGYSSKIGKNLLELCMGANYHNPMVVYREYVQNACDALYHAVEEGILSLDEDKIISIEIDSANKEVRIKDRGTGVAKDSIGPVLVDVGSSLKDGINSIGNYGIGRLVGANWCDRIVFETSAKGENVKSILTFDAEEARNIINSNSDDEFAEIMNRVTNYSSCKELESEHYFRVTLENAKPGLLDYEKAHSYLMETAPVPFQYDFENTLFTKAFSKHPDFESRIAGEKTCVISLTEKDNESEILKPYTPKVEMSATEQSRLTIPTFFELRDSDYGVLAWGWYSIIETVQQMNNNPFKGIRLRKHNMAVGNADMLSAYFPKPVDANYFVGELYISNDNIKPSGSRDGLRPSPEKEIFEGLLRDKFRELNKTYNQLSKLSSGPLKSIVESYIVKEKQSFLHDNGSADYNSGTHKDSKAAFTSGKDDLRKKLAEIDKDSDKKELANQIIQFVNKKAQEQVSSINASSKQMAKIEYISLGNLAEDVRKEKVEQSPTTEDVVQSELHATPQKDDPKIPSTPKEEKDTDVYKSLGKAEWGLMKIVYNVLDRDTKLDPISRERIKRKLVSRLVKDDA